MFILFLTGPPSLPVQMSMGITSSFTPASTSLDPAPSSMGPTLGPTLGPALSTLAPAPSSLGPTSGSLGPIPGSLDQTSSSMEPVVFKTTEFFSTLTDQGSVFKTTFDDVAKETFAQDISSIPDFSSSISSKPLTKYEVPLSLKGNETEIKPQNNLSLSQGFDSKIDDFGGFESADMPKVNLMIYGYSY